MKLKNITNFLSKYPMFRIIPSKQKGIILSGNYQTTITHKKYGEIDIDYNLEIIVSDDYPNTPPVIFETSNKIEKSPDNHINYDGSICLGSSLRLKLVLKKNSSLILFFNQCILPYLFAVTIKLKENKPFIFGELAHGKIGLYQDFQELFNLNGILKINSMLKLLTYKKREGNKQLCPCGCKKRISSCQYFKTVQRMRKLITRKEWIEQYNLVNGDILK